MNTNNGSFLSLTPLILFVALFLISTIFFSSQISPLFSCIVAIIYSFFTFQKKLHLNKKIEIFLTGSAHNTVIAMCYIFIFSAIFTYVLTTIGGIKSAVNIGLYLLPPNYILPGFFTIVSFFATAIGSSMGAIAAFLPIGAAIAQKLSIDPALMAGIVVSGAMLGDNLSIISDTTIAATQTTNTKMIDKFKANIKLVIPAFFLTIATLIWINQSVTINTNALTIITPTFGDVVKIIPYAFVLFFALIGFDVIAVLLLGIFAAIGIGVYYGNFSFIQGTNMFLQGFQDSGGIQEVLILVLLVAGLSHIVNYNGGIDYLLSTFKKDIRNKGYAELYISILVFLINAAIGINTIAILIAGPVAKTIADKFNIKGKRVASLLDVVACFCQGILPYAPQLLLAGSLAGISSIAIIPYLHYQWFIFLVTALSIGKTYMQNK